MEAVDDGSASPDSADENENFQLEDQDQALSKNRSKRKPSKTQIKHISQDAFDLPEMNEEQMQKLTKDARNNIHNTQSLRNEQGHLETLQSLLHRNDMNNSHITPVPNYGGHTTDGLYTDGSVDQEANNGNQDSERGSKHVKWSPKVIKQNTSIPQASSIGPQTSIPNVTIHPDNTQSSSPSPNTAVHSSNINHTPRPLSSKSSPCYPCAICGKVFRVPSRFDSHMLGHSKGKPFCCNTCGKMFVSQEKLDRHLPVHNCDRHAAFTCNTCGKVCVNWRAYLYHMKAKHTESGGKRFSCNLCGRQFHSGQRLRNHMASHEVGKNHCCHVCGKLFESHKKLAIHSLVHNLSSMHNQNLQCIDCGRQYTEWIAFKQHMKTHGTEGVHYPCGICGETFTTQYEKEKHKRVHKQVQCGVCNRYFRSSSVLSVHLRIHSGEKPYKCGLCNKEFSQLPVMKIHMRVHIKDGRYDCKICTAIFSDVMDYFKHYVAHFEDGNLQCEICGKIFDNIKKKNRHMAAHQDKTDRQCRICGKEFGRVSHLEAHMLCHSDNTPLMCKVCGKMFSSEEVLTAHYSVHVKADMNESEILTESPLFCGLCGKMFKDQEYLDKHMKRHETNNSEIIISQSIKSEDVMLDEDIVEVQNGQFPCKDCGKSFAHEDHLAVHSREHSGLKPHICVMCGQSFMLRKLLFEHGLTHRSKDLSSSTTIRQKKVNNKVSSSTSSLPGKQNDEDDSDSSSETDTDCDHEENVRQSKGKPHTTHMNTKSHLPPPQPSSVINHSFVPDELISSSQQTYTQMENSRITSSSPYITSTVSPLSSPSSRNVNESQSMKEQFTYRDPQIPPQDSNQLSHNMHNAMDSKSDSYNTNAQQTQPNNLPMLRPEPQMPVDMHHHQHSSLLIHQDFKSDVKRAPLSAQKSDPNSPYTCGSCGKVCVNWRAYVYHQRSRHSETDGKRFSCDLCGRQFYTRYRLKKHMLSHSKGKHHCCDVCGKLFESSKKLEVHSLVHNLSGMHDQDLQCGDCGKKYSDWIPFKQHMKTHGTEGVCYLCDICNESFPTQYELEKHRRVHKQFQCEFCDRYFRSASVLSVHLRTHTGERPYKCGLCDRDFSQSCVLKVHMRTHAKDGRYECKLCGLVLHDVMEYFTHHMAHLEEGNLQCEECGKMFDNINNKNRHMATHRDRDSHQCHVCGKEFGRVSHLEAHMLSHSESDPTLLTCKLCSKTFSSQQNLTAHYTTHLTNDMPSSDTTLQSVQGDGGEGPLFCGVCGKMFKDRHCLNKHMRKHDKEAKKAIKFERFIDEDVVKVENGQFACDNCGKTFGKADHLAVHRRQHTGEKPHTCCMCGHTFMLRSQLLHHIRQHRRSGVMMYLNLDAGEVCATMSDIKDVIKFSNAEAVESLSVPPATDSIYHGEDKLKTNMPSSHSQLPQKLSQNEMSEAKYHHIPVQNNHPQMTQAGPVPNSTDPTTQQHRFTHQTQILNLDQRLEENQNNNHHQQHHPSPQSSSDLFPTSQYKLISIPIGYPSSSNGVITDLSPSSHKKRQQLPPHSLSSTPSALYSQAISTTIHDLPIDLAQNVYTTQLKEGGYIFTSHHNVSNPVSSSDQVQISSRNPNTAPADGHNSNHEIHLMRLEQPVVSVSASISSPSSLHHITTAKTINSSHHEHHDAPTALFPYPRTIIAPSVSTTILPHQPLHQSIPPSITHTVGGGLSGTVSTPTSRFINPDIHHTLSNLQLLPQTAFPENSHSHHNL